jgi:hypothetical protein
MAQGETIFTLCVRVCVVVLIQMWRAPYTAHTLFLLLSRVIILFFFSLTISLSHPLLRFFISLLFFYSFHSRTFNLFVLISSFRLLNLLLSLSLSLPISLSLPHTYTPKFTCCSQINSDCNHFQFSPLLPLPLPYF